MSTPSLRGFSFSMVSRGGARIGAGRPRRKHVAEAVPAINICSLIRAGLFRPNAAAATLALQLNGAPALSLRLHVIGAELEVNGAGITQSIGLTWAHGQFARPWFTCPQCSQSVDVVYLTDGCSFRCRLCANVRYASQSMDAFTRVLHKQSKLRRRLGANGERPMGMHQCTYERMLEAVNAYEAQLRQALSKWQAKFPNCEGHVRYVTPAQIRRTK